MKYYMLYFFALLAFSITLPFTASLVPSRTGEDISDLPAWTESGDSFITVETDGIVCSMNLEDWTAYALAAEAPDGAPAEYLKAMAVALRTYAVYHAQSKDRRDGHPGSSLCDDPEHCRAIDIDGVTSAIREAVAATKGELIYYGRLPINPIMHVSSSVMTESALEAFGADVAYLVSVSTPDESGLSGFSAAVAFGENELAKTLESAGYIMSGDCSDWITYISYTPSGRVRSVSMCGYDIPGGTLVKLLGLSSANFTVKKSDSGLTFETEGIGSGVGMSKYGAYMMAEDGYGSEEIITHYYSGTYIGAE